MKFKDADYETIYKKLDPPVRKELNRLKRLAAKSITDLRNFEAYQIESFDPFLINPHSRINFGLSHKQRKILNNNVSNLPLDIDTKKQIYRRTENFFVDFRYEYHDRINFRRTFINNKAIEDLRLNFEAELDTLLSKYRQRHNTPRMDLNLADFQTKIMKAFHDKFDDDPLQVALEKALYKKFPESRNREQELIEKYAPANRPSYECYPPYLYDLSNYIQSGNITNYMPVLVEFLTSFQNTPFDIFDSFVINKTSLRALISKHRKSINKGI